MAASNSVREMEKLSREGKNEKRLDKTQKRAVSYSLWPYIVHVRITIAGILHQPRLRNAKITHRWSRWASTV